MSSTNKTLTIELSQYVGTDKPTYLTDYNGDMLKIDNAIAADRDSIATAQSKADGADAKADTNAGAITTLDNELNNASNGLAKRVTDVEGDVNTIESLIGNGTPTTSDKTLIGAINELDTIKLDISDLTASVVPVSTITGISANNVQAALAELDGKIESPTEMAYGEPVNITSYNSYQNNYRTHGAGIVYITGGEHTAGDVYDVYIRDKDLTAGRAFGYHKSVTTSYEGVSVFVPCDSNICNLSSGANIVVKFIPLVPAT